MDQANVKEGSRQGLKKVKTRSREHKHNLNHNYNVMGLDTIVTFRLLNAQTERSINKRGNLPFFVIDQTFSGYFL